MSIKKVEGEEERILIVFINYFYINSYRKLYGGQCLNYSAALWRFLASHDLWP
jgi:hypothetical protein